MTTIAKLLAQKQRLLERLQEDPVRTSAKRSSAF